MIVVALLVWLFGLLPTLAMLRLQRADVIEVVAFLNAFGFSVLSAASMVGFLFHLPLWTMIPVAAALSLFFAALAFRTSPKAANLGQSIERPCVLQGLTIVFILCAAALATYIGTVDVLSADTIHHLAFQRRFLDNPVFTLENFILSRSIPYDLVYQAYAGNSFSPIFALLSRLAGADPSDVLIQLNGYAMAALSCAMYTFARRLSKPHSRSDGRLEGFCAAALLGTLFWSCRQSYMGTPELFFVSYPNVFSISLVLIWTLLALDAGSGDSLPKTILACGLLFGVFGFHFQWLFGVVFCFGSILAFRLLSAILPGGGPIRPVIAFGGLTAATVVLAIAPRMQALYAALKSGSGAWTEWQAGSVSRPTLLGRGLTPDLLCLKDVVGITGCLCVFYLIWRRASDRGLREVLGDPMIWAASLPLIFYLFFFCPPFSNALLLVVPEPIMLRAFWFTDVLFMVPIAWAVGSAFAFVAALTWLPARQVVAAALTLAFALACAGFYYVHGKQQIAWLRNYDQIGGLTYSKIKRESRLFDLLSVLKPTDTILVVQRGPLGAMKKIELTRSSATLAEPVYDLGAAEKLISREFLIDKSTSSEAIGALCIKYDISYIVVWVWPGESEDVIAGRSGFSLIDEAQIPRTSKAAVEVRLYRPI